MLKCMHKVFIAFYLVFVTTSLQDIHAQSKALSIEKIMQGEDFVGHSPENIFWSEDGRYIYFNWNPDKNIADSLYKVAAVGGTPIKVTLEERRAMPALQGVYNREKTRKLYTKAGSLWLFDIKNKQPLKINQTERSISSPRFSQDETKIYYTLENNLFSWTISTGSTQQLTNFIKENKPKEKAADEQATWLSEDQLALSDVLRKRIEARELTMQRQKKEQSAAPKDIYIGSRNVFNIQPAPDGRYITYSLSESPADAKNTFVPNYVTESGYTENLTARPKVGSPQSKAELWIYDMLRDTTFAVSTAEIPGVKDAPDFTIKGKEDSKPSDVYFAGPIWSGDGKYNAVIVRSANSKDRWIMQLSLADGTLALLDRQRDEAWIAGPGVGWMTSGGSIGWMPDNRRLWFQSEASGYSHLYAVDVVTGKKKALTTGNFEVFDPYISNNKKNWYFISSEVDPGERHLYRMPLEGGKAIKLTSMAGNNEVTLSPDETMLAIRHSYANRPWELFIQKNNAAAAPQKVTNSLTEAFKNYPWRDPEIVSFKAADGALVKARIYRPENAVAGGPAVVFVHGAGYLQNVHKWGSSYFREYMFHNFLVDQGYTVLDIDYRGSAGYGRDWRTGIYRHMGGKDLSDHIDGARFLVETYGVDKEKIGIYGGSYGGFITLMAMFTQPDVFAAGAALRAVTDWAHYNHGYTSNILNTPVEDSIAYAKSSPIYYAEGLKGALLICHGMVDTNVHFQDVVRLTQRLIELGKDNWELAVYPLEDHGFVEPSSWTDEYTRIFKLFEENLK